MDFQKSCMFIDEAACYSHQIRTDACSVKGTPAIVKLSTQVGVILDFFRFTSLFGAINLSKVEPLKPSDVVKSRVSST